MFIAFLPRRPVAWAFTSAFVAAAALTSACSLHRSAPAAAAGNGSAARTSAAAAPAAALPPAAAGSAPIALSSSAGSLASPAPPSPPSPTSPPAPLRFEDAVSRAGLQLLQQARAQLGSEPRTLVIDPLIDANTGAQTVATAKMGTQLEALVKQYQAQWSLEPLTRDALASRPLLMIGTLTPVSPQGTIDAVPDAFRVWLALIDLRTGKLVGKQVDRASAASVDAQPLKFFADSPTWHKDKTVQGYINSCQKDTRLGDAADPDYLARLPAAAVVNEAILAYEGGRLPEARKLYREAQSLADPGDLRVLNGLYLTSWQLGDRRAARQAFGRLVATGLDAKRLPMKVLFQPGRTTFHAAGDLPQQYRMWIDSLAEQAGKAQACLQVVGHASRTGNANANETLSRQRAEAVQKMLERSNRALGPRTSATGVGSREALVGLGTDDARDALDRRVEFRVAECG